VLDNVIDALDKDPGLKGIKQLIVEGKTFALRVVIAFPSLTDFLFPFLVVVGKFHRQKRVSKKSQLDLRGVLLDVLSDVCKLNDEGEAVFE
jgi:hypothetical protein